MKLDTLPIRRALSKLDGPRPPRVLQVYKDTAGKYRIRLIASTNWRIISAFEGYYSKGNACQAAQREQRMYTEGRCAVVVTE